jgi:hypothetical protein
MAEYVAVQEADQLWEAAETLCDNPVEYNNSNKRLFIGCRFSPYFHRVPDNLDNLDDPNPGFGLASYHVEKVDRDYVRNLIENDLMPHSGDWTPTFEYASKRYHSSLEWAKTWLLKTLPRLKDDVNYPENIDDEACRKTHHALVVLQKLCPMPGFGSAQFFHALFDDSFADVTSVKHHRALYADFDTTKEGLPPWTAMFLTDSGDHLNLPQQVQTHPDCADFSSIRKFFETRLAYAFNTGWNWPPRDLDFSKPKGQEKNVEKYLMLAFPLFESQIVTGNSWKRKGPYLGLFALLVNPHANRPPEELLNCANRLGSMLNSLAAPIQAAREREFWSSRITENLDDQSMLATLREYAAAFCGVAIAPAQSTSQVATVKGVIGKLSGKTSGFVLPRVAWPQQDDRSQTTAWEAKWLPTTMVPTDEQDLTAFTHATMIRLRDAEQRIAAIRHSQEANRSRGLLSAAHDYSKDLNLLDSSLARFSGDLQGLRRAVQGHRSQSFDAFKHEMISKLDDLRLPEEQWLLQARFLMAHQRALNEGRLYEQPEWCLDLLKRGTRGALYRLIKCLVWLPVTWSEHASLASFSQAEDARESEIGKDGLSDWARLFAYDERGLHPEIDKKLGDYMRYLFTDDEISEARFWELHPPPQLNPGTPMTAQLLWMGFDETSDERWKPVGTLCPLLVFSLRAAFQHAWLLRFLQAAAHREKAKSLAGFRPDSNFPNVTLESIDSGTGMSLSFPNPSAPNMNRENLPPVQLPWGNWEREVKQYTDRGLCYPWHVGISHGKDNSTFEILIRSRK